MAPYRTMRAALRSDGCAVDPTVRKILSLTGSNVTVRPLRHRSEGASGLQILEQVLPHDIKASVVVEYPATGVTVSIKIKNAIAE